MAQYFVPLMHTFFLLHTPLLTLRITTSVIIMSSRANVGSKSAV